MLDIYKMVVIAYLVTDQANQVWFFKKTFLMANVSLKVVFEIPFLILISADINFLE